METDQLPVLRYALVNFEGVHIPAAVSADDLNIYIPLVQICRILQIDASAQIERIREHRALRNGLAKMEFLTEYGTQGATRMQVVNVIALKRFHAWLATIPTDRIENQDTRERLERWQEEAADVLEAYFARPITPDELKAEQKTMTDPDTLKFYDAMDEARKAKEMAASTVDRVAAVEDRLHGIELAIAELTPKILEFITPQQMRLYQNWVNILGDLLKKKGRGDIPTVQNELKDQFGFTSYKLIPAERFDAVRKYCIQWYKKLVPPGTPLPQSLQEPEQKKLL